MVSPLASVEAPQLTVAELLVTAEADNVPGWVGRLLTNWQSESLPSIWPSPSLSSPLAP